MLIYLLIFVSVIISFLANAIYRSASSKKIFLFKIMGVMLNITSCVILAITLLYFILSECGLIPKFIKLY